jgi:cell wall-associated NlpC family hydrolase
MTSRIDSKAGLSDRDAMRAFLKACCCLAVVGTVVLFGACSVSRPKPQPVVITPRAHHKGDINANDILFRAIGLVGTPYRHGGNTPQSGFDCSGLVDYVFRDVAGVDLPRTAHEISQIDAPQVKRDRLESGDIVFFRGGRKVSHVGIYVGRGRFVHAPNEGGTVRLDFLDAPYWNEHFSGAVRIVL